MNESNHGVAVARDEAAVDVESPVGEPFVPFVASVLPSLALFDLIPRANQPLVYIGIHVRG